MTTLPLPKNAQWKQPLEGFARSIDRANGFVVLDLDGTALLEDHGKVFISSSVEKGVKAIHDLKMPVVINTLRFPLSVMTTVGEAWYQIADQPILTVLLNGSILGYIKCTEGELHYEELAAFPLSREEIIKMLEGVDQLKKAGIDDVLFFFYSRDWREGETLWTPCPDKVPELQKKFVSASRVISGTVDELTTELLSRDICMTSLFIDHPEDRLMAYQHSKRNSFFTAKGVNKATGTQQIAKRFELDTAFALGAGDTEMDTFLSEVGFSVVVGEGKLPFRGRHETVRVQTPVELGELLLDYATFLK